MSDKADIRELAVAAWRLERWLNSIDTERKMAAKSALRNIKKYISACGIEVKEPTGSKFDPGLAVEVINNEAETTNEDNLIIKETVTPYVYKNGKLIQHARVIIGTTEGKNTAMSECMEAATKEAELLNTADMVKDKKINADTAESDIRINSEDIERLMAYAKVL